MRLLSADRRGVLSSATLVALAVLAPFASGEPPASDWRTRLTKRIADHPGEAAVAMLHIESGERFEARADEPFPTASLIKLPIMLEAYRQAEAGQLDLTRQVTLRDDDKVPGSGILTTHFSAGASFPLRDAVRMMIAWSDNTATNLVIDAIGLPATTEFMRTLDCPETRLHSKVFRRDTSLDLERSKKYGLGSTTARDMVRLLERIERRDLISPQACDAIRGHLAACQDKSMFPRHLSGDARVQHKTGGVTGIRTDAGFLVGPGGTVALCVLTRENRTPPGAAEDPGEGLCADVAKLLFDQFNPEELRRAARDRAKTLRLGDSGPRVMELQRLLNKALQPSPALDVDGEFGPITAAALKRFQRERGGDATGVADESTLTELRKRAP